MAFNGSGVYSPPGTDFPAVTQTVISSTKYNNVINDIATALSLCLTKDGQQTATANIPFGGFRATNVGITAVAGSVGTPAINVSDATTGLYRSAVSELAVSIAGTQRARFDSTGLIVTGAASVSTTLTATTSVVTPQINGPAGSNLGLGADSSTNVWVVDRSSTPSGLGLLPGTDNVRQLGDPTHRVSIVFTPIIDSGTTGSLSLKTNNGRTQLEILDTGVTTINWLQVLGRATGVNPSIRARGGDANVGVLVETLAAGSFVVNTDVLVTNSKQFEVLHTASSTRNITVTGSNGGNPTLGVTAGSLAITPDTLFAAGISVGGTAAQVSGSGDIRLRSTGTIGFLNSGSANATLIAVTAINGTNNIIAVGIANGITASTGVVLQARNKAGAPTTSDLATGEWCVWRDSSGATTKLYYNNAGALQSVALA